MINIHIEKVAKTWNELDRKQATCAVSIIAGKQNFVSKDLIEIRILLLQVLLKIEAKKFKLIDVDSIAEMLPLTDFFFQKVHFKLVARFLKISEEEAKLMEIYSINYGLTSNPYYRTGGYIAPEGLEDFSLRQFTDCFTCLSHIKVDYYRNRFIGCLYSLENPGKKLHNLEFEDIVLNVAIFHFKSIVKACELKFPKLWKAGNSKESFGIVELLHYVADTGEFGTFAEAGEAFLLDALRSCEIRRRDTEKRNAEAESKKLHK